MRSMDVLVIGGGPAGVAAAAEMARSGLKVTLCEQGGALGGAIHRQPGNPARAVPVPRAQSARWHKLSALLAKTDAEVLTFHAFIGLDATGAVLIEDRRQGRLLVLRVRALVLAVGGLERVVPRPGWHLPGVVTVGGLQVMMKVTGRGPAGSVLLAGSGPLLLAVAAQMTALGAPPLAILERSRQVLSPLRAAPLLLWPRYLAEAAGYMRRLMQAGVPWRLGSSVQTIRPTDDGRLETVIVDGAGAVSRIVVDKVALHDGLRSNSDGLPPAAHATDRNPHVVLAGDCREALGGVAAIADGRDAAQQVIARLTGAPPMSSASRRIVDTERRAQQALANIFDFGIPDLLKLPDETILCRCEGRTVGALRQMLATEDQPSPREIKLNGRIGMGSCQGRFCVEWAGAMLAQQTCSAQPAGAEFIGNRWPSRPVAIRSLLGPAVADAISSIPPNESD